MSYNNLFNFSFGGKIMRERKKNLLLKYVLILCSLCLLQMFIDPIQVSVASTSSSEQNPANQNLYIFKRVDPNSKSINIGNELLNNELYVSSIYPVYKFNGKLTWKENPYNDQTWCFYFQSLDMVGYLMNAYELDPRPEYLEKAKWFIESWMDANPSQGNEASPFAWSDHSTANRVVNIIYFLHYYKNSSIYNQDFENELINMLEKHGDYLADDKNYTKGNNHGIFQDRSLIELALLFPDLKESKFWYDKAMARLMIHVTNDVTPSGIHKEHSPSYHVVVLKLFKDIDNFICQFGINETELEDKITLMEDYLAYVAKPDGTLPNLGDSEPDSIYKLNLGKITSPVLQYVMSNGKKGQKPNNDAVYPDGGVGIFRNGWDKSNQLYLLFTAAYHSNVHKHADDLSFVLSYGKTGFFVDSGKYSYNETDPYRQYFRSTAAHNTITVDNQSYPLTNDQVNKSRIDTYKSAGYYSYIVGSHDLYKGVHIIRTIIYLKSKSSILIRDVIQSSDKHSYSEVFNIGNDVQIGNVNNSTFNLKSTIENKQLEFIQLTKGTKFNDYSGSTNPIAGWQSLSFNKKVPISQLRFTKSGQSTEYNSVINYNSKVGIKNFTCKDFPTYSLYTIVYKDGTRGNIKIDNNVLDKTSPAKPTVKTVSNTSTVVTGTTEASAKVNVTVGTKIIGTGQADSKGAFKISIPKQKAGITLQVYATDAAENKSSTVKVKVLDKIAPAHPSIHSVSDVSTTLVGTTEANARVTVTKGTKVMGTGKADSKGVFKISIPKQKAGTTLQVYATDSSGNKSSTVTVKVLDKTPPAKPIAHSVSDASISVTGIAEANSKVTVTVGTKVIGTGKADSKKAFKISIPKQKAGTTLQVYATDASGNKSSTMIVKVVDKTPPGEPTVNKVTAKSTTVTGKAEKGSTVYIYKGKKYIRNTITNSKGTYTIKIPKEKKGTILIIFAKDKAGNNSKVRTVKVN
jgi:hypothetical protein